LDSLKIGIVEQVVVSKNDEVFGRLGRDRPLALRVLLDPFPDPKEGRLWRI